MKLADLHVVGTTRVGLLGIAAGALYSLSKADQLNYRDARGQSTDAVYFANNFRSALKRIGRGLPPGQSWLGGYYYISALLRLAALLDRLDVPLAARSRSRLVHDVDWIKHFDTAHPASRLTTTWDDALKVADATCSAILAKPLGK